MLSRLIRLCIAAVVLLGSALASAALPVYAEEQGPADVVNTIVKLLKEQKSPEVVLDFVHWYTAFASFPEKDKRQISVNTPEELHQYYVRVFRDPAGLLREKLGPKIQAAPENARPAFEAKLKEMETKTQTLFAEMKDKLGKTEFTVGKASQQGDTATVELSTLLEGKINTNQVRLIKVDGKWMLPDPQFVRISGAEQQQAETGKDPGVTRIQPQPAAPPATANPAK